MATQWHLKPSTDDTVLVVRCKREAAEQPEGQNGPKLSRRLDAYSEPRVACSLVTAERVPGDLVDQRGDLMVRQRLANPNVALELAALLLANPLRTKVFLYRGGRSAPKPNGYRRPSRSCFSTPTSPASEPPCRIECTGRALLPCCFRRP